MSEDTDDVACSDRTSEGIELVSIGKAEAVSHHVACCPTACANMSPLARRPVLAFLPLKSRTHFFGVVTRMKEGGSCPEVAHGQYMRISSARCRPSLCPCSPTLCPCPCLSFVFALTASFRCTEGAGCYDDDAGAGRARSDRPVSAHCCC